MSQRSKGGRYSLEFRQAAVGRLAETANVSELCRELGISRQLLYLWRERAEDERHKQYLHTEQRLRQENAQLKKLLLEKTLEVDFFKGALQKVEALRRSSSGSGATASGMKSGK